MTLQVTEAPSGNRQDGLTTALEPAKMKALFARGVRRAMERRVRGDALGAFQHTGRRAPEPLKKTFQCPGRAVSGDGWICFPGAIRCSGSHPPGCASARWAASGPTAHRRVAGCPSFDILASMKSKDAISALSALASEARLAIFRLLVKRGPAGYTPTELTRRLGVPAPTLSFHLRELVNVGLVTSRREGRNLHYRAHLERMQTVVGFLTENCCSLAEEACGPDCQPLSAATVAADARKQKRRA